METKAPMAIDPNAIATALSSCNCEKKVRRSAVFFCSFFAPKGQWDFDVSLGIHEPNATIYCTYIMCIYIYKCYHIFLYHRYQYIHNICICTSNIYTSCLLYFDNAPAQQLQVFFNQIHQ